MMHCIYYFFITRQIQESRKIQVHDKLHRYKTNVVSMYGANEQLAQHTLRVRTAVHC